MTTRPTTKHELALYRKKLDRECKTEATIGLAWYDDGENGLPRTLIHEILDYCGDFSVREEEMNRQQKSIIRIDFKYKYPHMDKSFKTHCFTCICGQPQKSGSHRIMYNHTKSKHHREKVAKLSANAEMMTEDRARRVIMGYMGYDAYTENIPRVKNIEWSWETYPESWV